MGHFEELTPALITEGADRAIAEDAPARFQELDDWGGDFDRDENNAQDISQSPADVVARFQGGNNAGHTLVVDAGQTAAGRVSRFHRADPTVYGEAGSRG